jgi:hypothetical protein
MSTISSGTTLTTALVQTGDTTGDLVIKTGSSNTTALTISGTDQSVTIAGTLTANGSSITPSQWTSNSTAIYYNTGNVGIGVSSPNNLLDIRGASSPQITLNNTSASANDTTDATLATYGGSTPYWSRLNYNASQHIWKTYNTERMRIDSSGNVGIGTSSPALGLVVEKYNGSGYVAGFRNASGSPILTIQNTGGVSQIQGLNSALSATANIAMQLSGGNVGIGTASPVGTLHLDTSAGSASLFINSPSATGAGSYISMRKGGTARFLMGVESTLSGTSDNGLLYVYGANALTMYTNGTERMRIRGDGGILSQPTGGGTLLEQFGCRAWVNFNGTGTVAIRASGNVSSITDNSTGDYTINFTTAMPDANYAGFICNEAGSSCTFNYKSSGTGSAPTVYTTSACRIVTQNTDSNTVGFSVFR